MNGHVEGKCPLVFFPCDYHDDLVHIDHDDHYDCDDRVDHDDLADFYRDDRESMIMMIETMANDSHNFLAFSWGIFGNHSF